MLDVAAGRLFSALVQELAKRGAHLRLVGAHASLRDLLRAEGLEEQVGYLGRHLSIDQAIAECESGETKLESRL